MIKRLQHEHIATPQRQAAGRGRVLSKKEEIIDSELLLLLSAYWRKSGVKAGSQMEVLLQQQQHAQQKV